MKFSVSEYSPILSHVLTPRGWCRRWQRRAGRSTLSWSVWRPDHVDLPDGVTPLHKFIWRPEPLSVGDYIDELDSGSRDGDGFRGRDGDGFRVSCTPHKCCFTFLVVTTVRQVRLLYGYIRLLHEIRLTLLWKAGVSLTVDRVVSSAYAEPKFEGSGSSVLCASLCICYFDDNDNKKCKNDVCRF